MKEFVEYNKDIRKCEKRARRNCYKKAQDKMKGFFLFVVDSIAHCIAKELHLHNLLAPFFYLCHKE